MEANTVNKIENDCDPKDINFYHFMEHKITIRK